MQLFQQSEATAAQRRWFFACVDATDGFTPETGLTFSSGELQISKAGGAFANFGGTATELSDGMYYYEATATELNTVGIVGFKVEKTGVRLTLMQVGQVVPWDPYDAVRLGVTALPNANAEAAGGLFTRGTGAGQINQANNGNVDINVARWVGTIPLGLSAQRVEASVGAMQTDVLNSTALATSAVNEIVAALPTVASISDGVWDEARSGHVTAGTFGEGVVVNSIANAAITAASIASNAITAAKVASDTLAAIADAVWDEVMENSKTARQWMRGFKSALWGKLTMTPTSRAYRDDADTKDRIVTSNVSSVGRGTITEDLT